MPCLSQGSEDLVEVLRSLSDQTVFLEGEGLKVIKFYADWCPHCVKLKPVFDRIARENPGIGFAEVNVDMAQELSDIHKIDIIPTLVFFRSGKAVKTLVNPDERLIIEQLSS